jgi:DNA-binding beta-propeller fold protein YncE
MKALKVSMAALLVATALSGCGLEGDNGAPGATGATGQTGATGAAGPAGSTGANGQNAPVGMQLQPVARYVTGTYGAAAAEITAFHAASKRIFLVNGAANRIEVLDAANIKSQALSDPLTANSLTSQPLTLPATATVRNAADQDEIVTLGFANSISIQGQLLAVAVENRTRTDAGVALIYDLSQGAPVLKQAIRVGAQPDMLQFSSDGKWLLVANEGEPVPDYSADPEGSVSIITLTNGVAATQARTVSFTALNSERASLAARGVKFAGPANSTVAQDLEPEYVAFSPDLKKAWVVLQENNAVAIVDLAGAKLDRVVALGYKDHSLARNSLDISDRDGINLQTVPGLFGMYQPDTLQSYSWQGGAFYVSANEGDARDWSGFSEQRRASALKRSAALAARQPYSADGLGRLNVTTALGLNSNGEYDALYAYGARSFSIWDQNGLQVFDSGNDLERIAAGVHGDKFNSNHVTVAADNRSDDKGPEPEALALGQINGRTYAFIGTERMSGIYVYDISNPYSPQFVDYAFNRDLNAVYNINDSTTPATLTGNVAQAGDLGPESLTFVPATTSPTGKPLLLMANEVSGTMTVFELTPKA